MFRSMILVACLALVAAGCNVAVVSSDGSRVAYTYTVRGPDGNVASGQAEEFNVRQDGLWVEMDEGELTMNGASYGQIAEGATIVVDSDQVLVDGIELRPAE
jgi:hypothetical protein